MRIAALAALAIISLSAATRLQAFVASCIRTPDARGGWRAPTATRGAAAGASTETVRRADDGSAGDDAARELLPTDSDMALLQERIEDMRKRPRLPLVVLDAMLPRQRLVVRSQDPSMDRFVELGEIGVLGAWQGSPLKHGVVAKITQLAPGEFELRGQQHIEVVGPAETVDGLTLAKVEPVKFDNEEVDVIVAKTLVSLVEEWQKCLQRAGAERFEGQLRSILDDLGPMPSPEDAGELALWAAALVNPLPALGVAYEIRPSVLSAKSVSTRLSAVLEGIRSSIRHLTGEKKLF